MPLLLPSHQLDEIPNLIFSELSKGALKKKHPFRNVVLSTVSNGLPESRWVVFRKLTTEKSLLIYTDLRSSKVAQLRENKVATLLFYHSKQGVQIRLRGQIEIHHQNVVTRKYWPGVQGYSLRSYTTTLPPGEIIGELSGGSKWLDKKVDDFFVVLEFIPDEFEVLQLSRDIHIRASFSRDGNTWSGSYLVP